MRRSLLAGFVVLLAAALGASRAAGNAIVVTQAMKASTIAEIFVQTGSVRIELEVGLSDLRAFRNALPDDLYEGLGHESEPQDARWPRFIAEDFVVRADGRPLTAALRKIEGRRRVVRDEITGEPLPVAEEGREPVVYLEFACSLSGRPRSLTIRPPRSGRVAGANIGFVTYHEGLPVSDFRYLAQEVTLDLDWDDPWFSQFRHRNLRRRFSAPGGSRGCPAAGIPKPRVGF